jgi:hypothetical protein
VCQRIRQRAVAVRILDLRFLIFDWGRGRRRSGGDFNHEISETGFPSPPRDGCPKVLFARAKRGHERNKKSKDWPKRTQGTQRGWEFTTEARRHRAKRSLEPMWEQEGILTANHANHANKFKIRKVRKEGAKESANDRVGGGGGGRRRGGVVIAGGFCRGCADCRDAVSQGAWSGCTHPRW